MAMYVRPKQPYRTNSLPRPLRFVPLADDKTMRMDESASEDYVAGLFKADWDCEKRALLL
jgi:hypothetical protein